MQTFGDRLRAARTVRGMTQDALGEKLGVTKATISSWENNRDGPSFQYLVPLRDALQASIDSLLTSEQPLPESYRIAEPRAEYGLGPEARAQGSREVALLTRFRLLSERRQTAVLELVKPEKE